MGHATIVLTEDLADELLAFASQFLTEEAALSPIKGREL